VAHKLIRYAGRSGISPHEIHAQIDCFNQIDELNLIGRKKFGNLRQNFEVEMRLTWGLISFCILAWVSLVPLPGQDNLAGWRKKSAAPENNRYEGQVPQLVSGERIELLSFTRNMIKGDWNHAILSVGYFQPGGKKVVIVARDIEDRYRMETRPQEKPAGWQTFSPWPTAFQLEKMKIESEDLGVVGYATTDGVVPPPAPPTVVPVDVFSTTAGKKADDGYTVRLRSNFRMREPDWQVQDSKGKTAYESNLIEQEGSTNGIVLDKEPFQLRIPVAKLQTSGTFELVFTAKSWSTNQFSTFNVFFLEQEPWGR
jgi:hypothetical protein